MEKITTDSELEKIDNYFQDAPLNTASTKVAAAFLSTAAAATFWNNLLAFSVVVQALSRGFQTLGLGCPETRTANGNITGVIVFS